jgi:hypothetical protein
MGTRLDASLGGSRDGSTRRKVVLGTAAGVGGVAAGALLKPDAAEAASLDGYFNVKDHGAVGNGTTDDTNSVQSAIDAALAAGGGTVFFPGGTYLCNGLAITGNNVTMLGCGWASIIKQKTGVADDTYLISVKGTGTSVANNRSGIAVRNLQLLGRSDTEPFDPLFQHVHLLALSGVSDVKVENCLFKNWRGDAIYLGSFTGAGTAAERHNERVKILRCKLDGGGRNNRNAISVVDGTDVEIEGNDFRSCTASSMPGPVDIEPNNNAYHRLRNIDVRNNTFDGCGGNVAEMIFDCQVTQANLGTKTQGIRFRENTVRNSLNSTSNIYIRQRQTTTDSSVPNEITIEDNDLMSSLGNPLNAEGVRGLKVRGGYVGNSPGALYFGYAYRCMDVEVEGVHFHKVGTTEGTCLAIVSADRVLIEDNVFDSIGKQDGTTGRLVSFNDNGPVTSSKVDLTANRTVGTTATVVSAKAAQHTLDADTNVARANKVGNLQVNADHFGGGYRTNFLSVASAAAITIPADCDGVNVTGAASITSITASWPGRIVVLKFASSATVVDGPTLRLNGNTNFDASGDDTLTLLCDGTNWYELSRSGN